jgi:hypothetical protein
MNRRMYSMRPPIVKGIVPIPTKQERAMTYETGELNIDELDTVSGGLQRNPWMDAENQRIANQNKGSGFGASIGDVIPGLVVAGSGPNTAGHPFDPSP